MAITWNTYSHDGALETTTTTHEGLVVSPMYRREERVMSDVYADVSYCRVWDVDAQEARVISLGAHFELCNRFGTAVVDAPAEILAEVARQDAEREAARAAREEAHRAAQRAEQERKLRNTPEKGKTMRVCRGRKVPVGTVGEVFWVRDGRVGLALDEVKDSRGYHVNVAWVDAAYLEAV